MTENIETVIVGAGQAGLATAYHLTRLDRECLVLDGNDRVGDNWRQQWDSLRLYSPAKYDALPGMPFPPTIGTSRRRTRAASSCRPTPGLRHPGRRRPDSDDPLYSSV